MRHSVAVTGELAARMRRHLLRPDGQEDVLAATYSASSGADRTTAVLRSVVVPQEGERLVHGNASFTGAYVVRAAAEARSRGEGLVLLHSHPLGTGWQGLSRPDHDTESEYERVAHAFTKRPLVGMTLAGGDQAWSARFWYGQDKPAWAESVRTVSDRIDVSWNDALRPAPRATAAQSRTVSAWGDRAQRSMARLRVLVVGVGSVGLDIAQRLAATGLLEVGVMDFDGVEVVNLDRMIGATRLDAALGRPKVVVAKRLMATAATADRFSPAIHEMSITDPEGLRVALDYDVVFSCVDRPWPRAVMNTFAYADLIPVIDGGIALDTFADGRLRTGVWRAHTLVPERPCLVCMGQLDLGELSLDMQGLLDDPKYIESAGRHAPARQNVAALSASVSAAMLAQFVSLTAHPGGRGVPAPLRYMLAPHHLEHVPAQTGEYCPYESDLSVADGRQALVRAQDAWRHTVASRQARRAPLSLRALAALEAALIRRLSQAAPQSGR